MIYYLESVRLWQLFPMCIVYIEQEYMKERENVCMCVCICARVLFKSTIYMSYLFLIIWNKYQRKTLFVLKRQIWFICNFKNIYYWKS